MTTIEVRCGCGAVYQADASQVGRRLRCRCGRTPLIRRSPRAGFAAAAKDAVGRLRAAIRGRGREIPAAAAATSSSTPQTLLAWSVWIYLGAALLVWLALWQFADAWWPATVYLYGPRWLLILPLACSFPPPRRCGRVCCCRC